MLNSSLEIDQIKLDYMEKMPFRDLQFTKASMTHEEEEICCSVQTQELSEAKKTFASLPINMKITAMRYIFSQRIFQSTLLSQEKKTSLKSSYDESFGSLCAMNERGTETISLESSIITRVLYIAESMTINEFHRMAHILENTHHGYHVVMQVIKSRLSFHKMLE